MLTKNQKQKHNKYITGSKLGAILGLDPYVSKYTIYMQMKNLLDDDKNDLTTTDETDEMKMGSYMETVIHNFIRDEWGWNVFQPRENMGWKQHPKIPYIGCFVDRLLLDDDDQERIIAILEFKNVMTRMSIRTNEWNEGIPPHYHAQAYLEMMVYDTQIGYVVACFGGGPPKRFRIERDYAIDDFILEECQKFWIELKENRMPEVDGYESTTATIKKIYKHNYYDLLPGNDEILDLARNYEKFKEEEKKAITQKRLYYNKLISAVGNNSGFFFGDLDAKKPRVITWKKTKTTEKFNEEKFKEENPEEYAKYLDRREGYRRIYINI